MPRIQLTDSEFWSLVHQLGLDYNPNTGSYYDTPEYAEEATESLHDKLRLTAGFERKHTKKTRTVDKVWDAIKGSATGG